MVKFWSVPRNVVAALLPPAGFLIGWYLDKQQDSKLTAFRNKSRLYQRELKPGETETWT